jgi:dTDP-4-amino-4,6-dideoxygalactose transaminase
LPPPGEPPAHVWHQFVVRIPGLRDHVREELGARGVETRVFYPVPLHLQPCFADLGYRAGTLPVAEALAGEALSLPMFASLTESQVAHVCAELAATLAHRSRAPGSA